MRNMPRHRGTILCLALPLFPIHLGTPGVFFQPYRRCENKRPITRSATDADPDLNTKNAPVAYIHMYFDNTTAQGWANMGSISTASSVGPILRELYLAARRQCIHPSVGRVPGEDNKMADAASCLTRLPDRKSVSQFFSHFP